ncbi:hypothetical protein HYW54_03730 [Candidatus Gottesmanbacteria bacterium]|nr:hypothetical protein [Candidatus Gottesmanbacteria bacterium]
MWSFALVNGRLAEIYFDKIRGKIKIRGHCYVKREEFTTKEEQKWIEHDTAKAKLTYLKGKYKRIFQ